MTHRNTFRITYDNLLFLINRIEMMDEKLMGLETEDIRVKGVLKGRQESFL